ncbi:hypothetical protein QVA66_05105 [Staphylococcus chromogenes]|nr:hypothetical protein [Staphylococcus chromogenes]
MNTWNRWHSLWTMCRDNPSEGRLQEAHLDATTILQELSGPAPQPNEFWGVWAAEPPSPRVEAELIDGTWRLSGTKPWCSGAGRCTHALITATAQDGKKLFAAGLEGTKVTGDWGHPGMRDTLTYSVEFNHHPATLIGTHADYLHRPGFWDGGIGVAACWLGSAAGLIDYVDKKYHLQRAQIQAQISGGLWMLRGCAAEVDENRDFEAARVRALIAREQADAICQEILRLTKRCLGAGPLVNDPELLQRINDVEIYTRQSHGDRDLEWLGELL